MLPCKTLGLPLYNGWFRGPPPQWLDLIGPIEPNGLPYLKGASFHEGRVERLWTKIEQE